MVTRNIIFIVVLLAIICGWYKNAASAANILAMLPVASRSHHIWNRSLMLALAERGHQVTVVSPDPEKQPIPNHTDIVLEGVHEQLNSAFDYEAMSQEGYIQNVISVFDWGQECCKFSLASKGAKQLLDLVSREKFDLIIVDEALTECFFGFIPEFGFPPVVAITAYSCPPWAGHLKGNPDNPSYVNTYNLPYSDHMNFFQRMANMLLHTFTIFTRTHYHMPRQQKLIEDFLGKPVLPLTDIEKNISVVLVNIHNSMDYPRPMVPALIPVAGMHIKPSKSLPKDLQKYLDEAKEGVIYFSLGSNLRSDKLSPEKRQIILDVFSNLPYKVLWKWESDSLPGQPKNVKIGKWLPQNDILGHPNVKLFITHSGLLSSQEAIYHGVPVVGIPFLADQYVNIQKSVTRGVGEFVDFNTMTKQSFLSAIRKVLHTPSYAIKMKRLSEQFRDRPQTAVETAVYWTEYVLKHKGAPHLRSATLDLPWYQYFLLDVIAFLIAVTIIVLLTFLSLFKRIYVSIRKPKKTKKKEQ